MPTAEKFHPATSTPALDGEALDPKTATSTATASEPTGEELLAMHTSGQTVRSIARRFGMSVTKAWRKLNAARPHFDLAAWLDLPDPAPHPAPPPGFYSLIAGASLEEISCKLEVREFLRRLRVSGGLDLARIPEGNFGAWQISEAELQSAVERGILAPPLDHPLREFLPETMHQQIRRAYREHGIAGILDAAADCAAFGNGPRAIDFIRAAPLLEADIPQLLKRVADVASGQHGLEAQLLDRFDLATVAKSAGAAHCVKLIRDGKTGLGLRWLEHLHLASEAEARETFGTCMAIVAGVIPAQDPANDLPKAIAAAWKATRFGFDGLPDGDEKP